MEDGSDISGGSVPPAPLPLRRTRFPKVSQRSGRVQLSSDLPSRIWNVRRSGDAGAAGDTFEVRVQRIEKRLRAEDVGPSIVSTEEIVSELTKQGGHAGRTLQSLLPELSARIGTTVEADRTRSDQPVLPEFMVHKVSSMATSEELKQQERDELERQWKTINKSSMDEADFIRLLKQLGIAKTIEEANVEFRAIDVDGSGCIDFDEFQQWVVEQRQDQSIKVALSQIGHRRAWAHIKIPQVRWKEMANYPRTRSLKFLAARSKVRPSSRYWVEVVGSRLSIFDSSDRVKELARLRLSDPEVERSSLGARRAEGWGDETSQDLTVNTADETQSNQGHPHHDVVIELWIRLQSGTELYRIAIDLSEHGLAAVPDRKSWVDAISVYISDKTQHRSGALLWHILAKRLKLVVELQKHFGDIHDLYGASSSGFEETIVPQYIRHPDSKISQAWDTLQLLLLLLVCYYVPLRTGFDVAVELWSYEFWQDAFIDLYFIADVIVQFRTAYWNASGVLVVDIRDIRRKYLKGWFLIDFVCVLPLGYVGYFVADSGKEGTGSFRAVKSLRLLRMGKMMRLTKVYKMVRKYDNSAEIRGYIGIFGLVFLVLLASHLLASFWFLIGSNDQVMSVDDGRGELIVLKGWVNQKAEEDPWWGERGLNASLTTRYVTSMYGIFNALENGFTDSEKAFAIFAELIVGSVIYGGLAAVLSAALMESKQDSEEFNKNYKSLKMWLKTRKVHTNYQRKVLAAYSHKFKDSTTFDEQHLLKELPPAMASNLLEKLYGQYLAEVPYFRDLDQVVIVRLAQAVKTLTAEKDSIIMEEGKTGKEMFILVEGEVVVEQQGTELGFFRRPGSFFGENPLIYWQDPDKQLRDRTVSAVTDSFLVFLELGEVVQVARRYPQLQAELMKFRRVGGTMRKQQNQSSSNGQRIDSVAHEPLVREADLTVQAVGPAVSLGMSPDAQNPHGDAYSPGVSTAELSTLIDRKFAMLRTVMVQQMQDEIRMNFERLESTLLSAMQDTGRAGGSDRSDDLVPRRHAARP